MAEEVKKTETETETEKVETPVAKTVNEAELNRLKTALSKSNAEAAEYKRLLREKQTEAERAEAERIERDKARDDELKAYRDKERVSTYTAKLLSAGFDAESASAMAAGLPDGISDDFFDRQKMFITKQKQIIDGNALSAQMNLSQGAPVKTQNVEDATVAAFRKACGL